MCARSQSDEVGDSVVVNDADMKQMLKKKKRVAIRAMRENEKSRRRDSLETGVMLDKDLLALSTAYYRLFVCAFSDFCSRFQKTKTYT